MATRQGRRNTAKRNYAAETEYVHGSTVRELAPAVRPSGVPSRRIQEQPARRRKHRLVHMNLGSLVFLTAALLFVGFTLISYLQLQIAITNSTKRISTLESQYVDLKLANDEKYNTINSSVDLESIKQIAIGELGMTYASGDQVVFVEGHKDDYVRQISDIPQ
ncbi:MAG: cell division protein FtsL [Lachnospiraceae bacterium]|nr:cell division protein FtsL [Lachnospiraceae bacterium]